MVSVITQSSSRETVDREVIIGPLRLAGRWFKTYLAAPVQREAR